MSHGIVYVAFGTQYDEQCACSARIVRGFSDIPIFVVSNLEKRSQIWEDIPNVEFRHCHSDDHENDKRNRAVKVSLHLYSPFETTLFCDTDTAVQSDTFLDGFYEAEKHDVMFSIRNVAKLHGNLPDINYKKAFKLFNMSFPATIYKEGVFFFRKTPATCQLFTQWYKCWKKLAVGRDMPALFAACQLAKADIGILPFGWDSRDGHIIVHGHGDFEVPGLPRITKFKPNINSNPEWRKIPPSLKC
jgi:hypothetical protein